MRQVTSQALHKVTAENVSLHTNAEKLGRRQSITDADNAAREQDKRNYTRKTTP